MKSRPKPERKEHESMMKRIKKKAKAHSPEAKEKFKAGAKKIKKNMSLSK